MCFSRVKWLRVEVLTVTQFPSVHLSQHDFCFIDSLHLQFYTSYVFVAVFSIKHEVYFNPNEGLSEKWNNLLLVPCRFVSLSSHIFSIEWQTGTPNKFQSVLCFYLPRLIPATGLMNGKFVNIYNTTVFLFCDSPNNSTS